MKSTFISLEQLNWSDTVLGDTETEGKEEKMWFIRKIAVFSGRQTDKRNT